MSVHEWSGRVDSCGLRLHQQVQCRAAEKGDLALVGYPFDHGIGLNQGRLGAKEGPKKCRQHLGNLPQLGQAIVDLGDAVDESDFSARCLRALGCGAKTIGLGGGHDMAWAHGRAIVEHLDGRSLAILNVDAHLDIRPLTEGANSGTPFTQLRDLLGAEHFHYAVLGAQQASNTRELFEQAQDWGVELFEQNDRAVEPFIEKYDHLYLSVDLDAFDMSFAPGVSAPCTGGLTPSQYFPSLRRWARKAIAFDVAELSPPNDVSEQTARLAARLVWEMSGGAE
jgi:formiminoglutamase